MRIALVHHCFDPQRGGAEHWTWQLAQGLLQRGHEVHVLAKSFTAEALRLPVVPHRLKPRVSQLEFAAKAGEMLRGMQFDVVHDMGVGWHCDLFQPHSGCLTSLYERNRRAWPLAARPLKRAFDYVSPRKQRYRKLARRQFGPDGPLVVALSEFIAADLRRRYELPEERIRLVRNGVDTVRFSPETGARQRERTRAGLDIGPDELVGMFIAKNLRLKGFEPLLRALSRCASEGIEMRILVVGSRLSASWRSLARVLRVENRLIWMESTSDAAPLYAAADFLIHPTFYDACSLVLLEGAAAALPLITARASNGFAELMEHGKNGLLVESAEEHTELAKHLATMTDAGLRNRLGTNARQLALEHTFERNLNEIIAVYEEIAAGKRSVASSPASKTLRAA